MQKQMTNSRLFSFVAGNDGPWKITEVRSVIGQSLDSAERLNIVSGEVAAPPGGWRWNLRGATSNERYVTRAEKDQLVSKQQGLGRITADCAALIPIRKRAEWWMMTQDERLAIFEEQSQHTAIGLKYLPAIARRLHHCRDLSTAEPFDFLTWFEFSQADAGSFDQLLAALRGTPEWKFVDREVEIRLVRSQN